MAWSLITAVCTLFCAVFGPFFGAFADITETRKFLMLLAFFVEVGACIVFVSFGLVSWVVAIIAVCLTIVGNILNLSLYNSMMLFVHEDDDLAQVSAWGAGLSNLG